jgi:hypothetical protein
MRKPTPPATRTIVLAALSLLFLASSCDSKVAERADYSRSGPGHADTVAMPSGYLGGDAPRSYTARAMAAPAPAMAPKVAAPRREAAEVAPNADAPDPVSLGTPMPAADPAGAMIVRHGEASVQVQQVEGAVARIRQTAAQFGGFVGNASLVTGKEEQKTATLELRIPSPQFDAVVGALNQLGKVETVTVSAEDVSEEYVDLGARLANARRVEARLVEMLATRTGKLSDVLTVEQELARVRQ